MKPRYIKVKNLGSYIDEEISFDTLPSPCIVMGANGAGKTTLFTDALTIALFNRARATNAAGYGMDNLIHNGKDFLEVEFEFEMNGHVYKIIRRRSLQAHELEFYIDGFSHAEKIVETERKIKDVIKMNYDTFIDTVCIGQGKSSAFMDKKPDERKGVFSDVLGLNRYDILENETKELRKNVADEISNINRQLESLGDVVAQRAGLEHDVIVDEKKIGELEFELQTLEVEYKHEFTLRNVYEAQRNTVRDIIDKRDAIRDRLTAIRGEIRKNTKLTNDVKDKMVNKDNLTVAINYNNKTLEEAQERYQRLANKQGSLATTIDFNKKQAKEFKDKYVRLKNHNEATCDFCRQEITAALKERTLSSFKQESMALITEVKHQELSLTDLNKDINEVKESIIKCKAELTKLKGELDVQVAYETKLVGYRATFVELQKQEAELRTTYAEMMAQDIPEPEDISFKDKELAVLISTTRDTLNDLKTKVAIAKLNLTKISENEDLLKQLEAEGQELQVEHDVLTDLVRAWGKSGIQANIIEGALPEIQDEINEILDILSDGKSKIEFRTQKLKKAKSKNGATMMDTLDILVHDEGDNARIYETFSGGEKFRIDFACHVGLARYLAKRAGAAIRFFVIDEGIGSQDAVAQALLHRCINGLTSMFDNVIVISHVDDFVEEFNSRLVVYKDSKYGSKIKFIN